MAYLETLSAQVCGILTADGVQAFPEYGRRLDAIPQNTDFATVGSSSLKCETPLVTENGWYIPAAVTLRVRLHCRTQESADALAICMETVLLPGLLDRGYAVEQLTLGETAYSKTLDRLVREVQITLSAAILRRQLG